MTGVLVASAALAIAGPVGALSASLVFLWMRARRRRPRDRPLRPVLILILVELRSGQSALGALQRTARKLPLDRDLVMLARTATVEGLGVAAGSCAARMRGLATQLARAQQSGAALADTVRSLLEADINAERSRRVEAARSLPVRLMLPVALLVLPGTVLMLYAPSLLRLLGDIAGAFT